MERRLAAILAADVAGYSRLMGSDEEGTLTGLKSHRQALVDPKITEHRGRIVKTTGDGMLVEFASVVDALRCAVEIQRGMQERNASVPPEMRIQFRIGINVGDIIIDGDDIYGDGVNVASRIEALAEPGGICVSQRTREDTEGRLDVAFEDTGEQQLKNIARPVRVFRVDAVGMVPKAVADLALPDKPSIAVLPFQNMSGDPEQDYFSDGVVEDIITALSRLRWLFVIARNSSFVYKGRAVDVKQVGRELGVRYVLEGSVRKAANRIRITGQLIDAVSGAHLWADRFDGLLEDIFDLQDQVTASVVGAIAPKLEQAEIERAKRKPTESLDAYDYFLRGMAKVHQGTRESTREALDLFYGAIGRDADFAAACGMAAWCYDLRKWNGWVDNKERETAETARLARRAIDLGKDDAVALCWGGFALAHTVGELDDGATALDRATALNPNLASAWHFSGWVSAYLGDPDTGIERIARAIRLSPLDPFAFLAYGAMAFANIVAGRYEEATTWAQKSVRERPSFMASIRMLAAGQAKSGRLDEARATMARMRELDPAFRVADVKAVTPLRRPEDLARYADALRLAGLPD
jgi:adenylate cyclase